MVKYGAISRKLIRAANLKDMKARFLRSNPRAVFNSNNVEHIKVEDAERFQLVTKEYEKVQRGAFTRAQRKLLETCEAEVLKVVQDLLPEIPHFKTIESILYSRDGSVERQKLHADLDDTMAESGALALVALEPHTTFIMCGGSHSNPEILETRNVHCFPRVYELSVGDILIFHPNLVHAGDKFPKSNMRVHYYVLDQVSQYELDVSYHVDVNITDKFFAMVKGQERRMEGSKIARKNKATAKQKRSRIGAMNISKRWYPQSLK